MRRVLLPALLGVLVLLALAPAAFARRAMIAFIPTQPAPKMPLLFDLEQRNFAYGVTSPTIGSYSKRQMLLDMSAGTRIANGAYGHPLGRLDLDYGPGGGRMKGWFYDNKRAENAPGDVLPGLFTSTLERAGHRVAYAGVVGFEQTEAVVAASRAGAIEKVSLGTIGTFPQRALDLWRSADVVVARFPPDAQGLEALDRIVAARQPGDMIYAIRAPPPGRVRLLPTGMLGPGFRAKVLYSPTTRRPGLVAATDMAPTLLHYLGVKIPKQMEGRVMEARSDGNAEDVRARMARLDVVLGRRGPALRTFGLALVLMALALWSARRRAGLRVAARIAFLAALWLPGAALATAVFEPSWLAELLALSIGSIALGALTDRLLPWPLAPALPAAVVFGAHAVDLARGSPWIGASIAGPNPKGGSRFFGIGNELEIMLSLEVLLGLGAALTRVAKRYAARMFAFGCLVAAAIIGSGRLGADVGGVITLGAGAAGAVLASMGGRLTRRRLALAALVPVAALVGLVALDLATSGGAHLTRTVIHGNGPGELVDIARRRLAISVNGLNNVSVLVTCVIGVVACVIAVRRRDRLYAPLRDHPAFMAGIWGGLSATVIGALSNDSGPVIFALGFLGLLFATGYVWGRPGAVPARGRNG
ncbi:MAG: hypothetical protein QOC77_2546 [Thermoleophilaceae bacterium]|nr:hypothetical protein [Thermoleophilaceae bacterium]MEA2469136.1 hypothetical protein [Thermoleophilaceae bacterium]